MSSFAIIGTVAESELPLWATDKLDEVLRRFKTEVLNDFESSDERIPRVVVSDALMI